MADGLGIFRQLFGCPAENVDQCGNVRNFLKHFVIFWLFRIFWGKFGHP